MLAIFLAGIILIVKGGDYFVDAASWIAEVSGVPKLIVGATIVSLATTLPEMLVSLMAAAQGKVDMAVGNAAGSVTANIGLIMALSVLCMPVAILRGDYLLKSALMLAAAGIVAWAGGRGAVGLRPSLLLLGIFGAFLFENVRCARRSMRYGGAGCFGLFSGPPRKRELLFYCAKFTAGAAAVVLGADLLVDSGSALARLAGVSERVVGGNLPAGAGHHGHCRGETAVRPVRWQHPGGEHSGSDPHSAHERPGRRQGPAGIGGFRPAGSARLPAGGLCGAPARHGHRPVPAVAGRGAAGHLRGLSRSDLPYIAADSPAVCQKSGAAAFLTT